MTLRKGLSKLMLPSLALAAVGGQVNRDRICVQWECEAPAEPRFSIEMRLGRSLALPCFASEGPYASPGWAGARQRRLPRVRYRWNDRT
jgi:hypothetical protein